MRLRRVDCSGPGITRRRHGRGFTYLDTVTGERVTDPDTLDRVRGLAIPPAWTDVWICPAPNGHLQATGVDAAGRMQYRYHPEWRRQRDLENFDEMLDFARALPALRARCDAALRGGDGPTGERVLAAAVRLLDRGFFRVGGETYTAEHASFGLATIEKRHLAVRGDVLRFDYAAKGGKRRVVELVDGDLARLLSTCKRRRGGGDDLLAYKRGSRWVDVTSADVNDAIKDLSGGDFSAKDFRTWNATVYAALTLAVARSAASSKTAAKRAKTFAARQVADLLGNTPAVARASYIDPRVFDRFDAGWTVLPTLEALGADAAYGSPAFQGAIEGAVVDLLEERYDADGVARDGIPSAA